MGPKITGHFGTPCFHLEGYIITLNSQVIFVEFFDQDEVLRRAVQLLKGKNWKKIGKSLSCSSC
jgi:hypothetical protein